MAMCENIDDNVGRLLDALDRLGIASNTIVVYFSDNGPNSRRWNGGMKGHKGHTDEGGVRSPCFLRWPGRLPAGRVVTNICGAIDLLPTLTALAGVPHVGDLPLDGCDLSPLLEGGTIEWPDRPIFAHWNGRVSVRPQRFRMDAAGALYDMWTDPGQGVDVCERHPEAARRLAALAEEWRRQMGLSDIVQRPDERPFPVGYREFPRTVLPARDGRPVGRVRRSAQAPNCSYFVGWSSPEGRIVWDVAVATAGEYEVEILYTCAAGDEGSEIELSVLGAALRGRVEPAWDPPLIVDQDVIPRPKAESMMKDFRPLRLGRVRLPAGRGPLELRATSVVGREVMHLRSFVLTLVDPAAP